MLDVLFFFGGPFLLSANILIAQELVICLKHRKLFQLCLVPMLLCPLIGFVYANDVPLHVIGAIGFTALPTIRLLLSWKIKTQLGYMLVILLPSTLLLGLSIYCSLANWHIYGRHF